MFWINDNAVYLKIFFPTVFCTYFVKQSLIIVLLPTSQMELRDLAAGSKKNERFRVEDRIESAATLVSSVMLVCVTMPRCEWRERVTQLTSVPLGCSCNS